MVKSRVQLARVLVVDDEPPACLRLQAMVEDLAGYTVIAVAGNGDQALQACEEHRPDIVLMDIRMPGIDGLQAARALTSLERPPAVIFCTAYDEHALSAFEANAIDYLLKPIKQDHLVRALARAGVVNRVQFATLHNTALALGAAAPRNLADAFLTVKTSRGEERIKLTDIRVLMADSKYVSAYTEGREIILDQSLRSLEAEYADYFVRVHRNALVAIPHLIGLEKVVEPRTGTAVLATGRLSKASPQWQVRLSGVEIMPLVSRRHAAEIRRVLRAK